MSVTHTHQTAIADDGSDVGANVWNADHTIAAPLTVPGTANTSSLVGTGYSLTGSNAQALQSWSGTLNTSGVVDVIKVSITDTAHGASSNIMRLQGGAAGNTDLFAFSLGGVLSITPTAGGSAQGIINAGVTFSAGGNQIGSAGTVAFSNGANFSAALSRITGTGALAVGTGAVGATDGTLQAAILRTTATVVASLPAAATAGAGAHSFVTDATQTMTAGIGAAVVGGGANKVPVYCDGTGWFIG